MNEHDKPGRESHNERQASVLSISSVFIHGPRDDASPQGVYALAFDRLGNIIEDRYIFKPNQDGCELYAPDAIIKNGDRYAVSGNVGSSFIFCLLDQNGARIRPNTNVTDIGTGGYISCLVQTGQEYGILYQSNRAVDPLSGRDSYDIYLMRMDAEGNKIGSDIRLTDVSESQQAYSTREGKVSCATRI